MFSVVGKLYYRVLIKRERVRTECAIGEEQCGFRQGRGCMDQVFAVRQGCDKSLQLERCILGVYGFRKGIRYDRLAWHVADAKSVWSWRKIIDSSTEFVCI